MEQEQIHNDLHDILKNEKVVDKILYLVETRYKEENKDVVDLSKNYGIDIILARFYKTFKLTEDTDNVISLKQNDWIRDKYLFKNFKKALKDYDLYYKGYVKAQEKDNSTYYSKVRDNKLIYILLNWFKNLFKRKKNYD